MTFLEVLLYIFAFFAIGFCFYLSGWVADAVIGILRKKFPKFNSLFVFRDPKN